MLRFEGWIFGAAILAATGLCCFYGTSHGDGWKEPFLSLAKIRVNVTTSQLPALAQVVRRFAESRHFQIKDGDYPKDGRPVINRIVELDNETFFKFGNFRNENIIEIVAYSHQDSEIWNPSWNELVSMISSTFGEANVTRVEGP
jgi:hypothetical protein